MKTLLGCLTVAAFALVAINAYFDPPATPHVTGAEPGPAAAAQVTSSESPSPSPLAETQQPSHQAAIPSPRPVVSQAAIDAAIDDEIARLRDPFARLFQEWGLPASATQQVLDIHRAKMETHASSRSTTDFSAVRPDARTSTTHLDKEIIQIIGSTGRFYELTKVITQVNTSHLKATAPKRRAQQDEYFADKIEKEIAELKKTHGTGYREALRQKYGDQSTATILAMLDRTRD